MSDYAHADESVRTTRGPWTSREDLAGTQAAGLTMAAMESSISIAVSAGNTSLGIQLPPIATAMNGDIATIRFKNNACRMATAVHAPGDHSGATVRQGPVAAGELWKFEFTAGWWRPIGP